MATRDQINEAVRLLLVDVTGKPIGMAEQPVPPDPDDVDEAWPTLPYAVLYPGDTGPGEGGMDSQNEEKDMLYSVTCVGRDARQCAWMSSKVEAAFTAERPGGGYLHDLPLVGSVVQWRLLDGLGATVPSGESLFSCNDQYRLRVGKG